MSWAYPRYILRFLQCLTCPWDDSDEFSVLFDNARGENSVKSFLIKLGEKMQNYKALK
jgi:hypothetical protein